MKRNSSVGGDDLGDFSLLIYFRPNEFRRFRQIASLRKSRPAWILSSLFSKKIFFLVAALKKDLKTSWQKSQ